MTKTAKKISKSKSASKAKSALPAKDDGDKVITYMENLDHPLKAEIEAVRNIIKGANSKIGERIKWNVPSYYFQEDIVTFNPRTDKHVHLVFHHPFIVKIKSDLLVGDYVDRRMTYLKNMAEI